MGEYLLDWLAEIWPRIKNEMVNAKYNLLNTDWAWSVRCMVIGSYEKKCKTPCGIKQKSHCQRIGKHFSRKRCEYRLVVSIWINKTLNLKTQAFDTALLRKGIQQGGINILWEIIYFKEFARRSSCCSSQCVPYRQRRRHRPSMSFGFAARRWRQPIVATSPW